MISFDRLFIVAGPRGCGKSHFLSGELRGRMTGDERGLSLFDRDPVQDYGLKKLTSRGDQAYSGELWLHLDSFKMVASHPDITPQNIRQYLTADLFAQSELLRPLRNAAEIHILTIHASRREILDRWMKRNLKQKLEVLNSRRGKQPGLVSRLCRALSWRLLKMQGESYGGDQVGLSMKLAAVYCEDDCFRLFYEAWFDYVDSLNPDSSHVLDTSGGDHRIVRQDRWRDRGGALIESAPALPGISGVSLTG